MERQRPDEPLDQLLTRSLRAGVAPGEICPDTEVLAAFIDDGLDAAARLQVERHAASCARCSQILAVAIDAADAPSPAATLPPKSLIARWRWAIPLATAATVAGIWIATRDATDLTRAPVQRPAAVLPESAAESAARLAPALVTPPLGADPQRPPSRPEPPRTAEKARTADQVSVPEESREAAQGLPFAAAPPAAAPPPPAAVPPLAPEQPTLDALRQAASPAAGLQRGGGAGQGSGRGTGPGDGQGAGRGGGGGTRQETVTVTGQTPSVDVQNARQAALSQWRFRGTVVERSADGGATWATDFDAGRQILTGTTPAADVAWFGGARGLVVRRTGGAWVIVAPPADVDVTAIQAVSDSAATVTLADGRTFATADGGVTWSAR